MTFTKRLREGVRRGEITCSVRIWTRPHVKVGARYRCLEPVEFPIDSNFDLFYRPEVQVEYGEEVEIDEGEVEIAF